MARPLHLYVHVPFCERKCPYCHFYNLGHDDAREALYVDGIAREIARGRERGAFERGRLTTLYWGGGTPSLLSDEAFDRLADLCLGVAPRGERFEWTTEVNPVDATDVRFLRYRERGVTRVSIGVQSFDDRRLSFLGRNHDAEAARMAIRRALATGFDDVSIDLIFNLSHPADPAERRRAWAHDLSEAFAFPITHLSLYGLTLEPGTAFDARARRGEALTVPDPAYAAEYRAACRAARRAGFEHYEVSSFARLEPSGCSRRSRHNAAYWVGAPYLGLGPAAHSFDGVHRWANVSSLVTWAEALSTGGDPRAFVEMLTPAQRHLETLYLGLRTCEGVPASHPLLSSAGPLVAAMTTGRLLTERDHRMTCTEAGFAVLDAILDRLTAHAAVPNILDPTSNSCPS
jgi:oxygen-independent coproporphyrinogen-3 oxidase